ncbi:conserved protein of unknown function [Nitrosotalea devaniterrae]|uniref:DUF3892 domain-containing protein n=1 Tax=Nitrosotalea devaniterrae TaxID=1078905 RepID=A0A128A663_9ARCH|nr:conserved protein of unknown function [Candidatus Nitrosotalea devanaterra]
MTKWADYLISHVRYNVNHPHIDQVWQREDINDKITNGNSALRSTVVSNIKAGLKYATITKNSNGNWDFGQYIIIDRVNGIDYIKTKADNTTSDNLGNLPTF